MNMQVSMFASYKTKPSSLTFPTVVQTVEEVSFSMEDLQCFLTVLLLFVVDRNTMVWMLHLFLLPPSLLPSLLVPVPSVKDRMTNEWSRLESWGRCPWKKNAFSAE